MRWSLLLLTAGCIPRLFTTDTVLDATEWVAPDNRWPLTPPPVDLAGEGWEPGNAVPDVRFTDQFGEEVSLWQFHGQVVLFDISTMWCAPCRELAAETQATATAFEEDPFVYLTVLMEDVEGGPPTQEDLNLWADNFQIRSAPVVEDGGRQTIGAIQANQFPAVLVIGPDLRVRERVNPPDDAQVHRAIEEALHE